MAKKPVAKKSNKKKVIQELNETGRRSKSTDRRKQNKPATAERRKVQRRRQIDPTTCERDYTDAEIEFMHALDAYKRQSGRMFPTCSEILEVIEKLGYQKTATSDVSCHVSEQAENETSAVDLAEIEDEFELTG